MTLVSPGSSSRLLCYYLDVALEALNRNHVCKNSCLVWSAFWCVSSREKEWIICPSSIPASAWAIYWHNNQEQRHVINSSTGEGIIWPKRTQVQVLITTALISGMKFRRPWIQLLIWTLFKTRAHGFVWKMLHLPKEWQTQHYNF